MHRAPAGYTLLLAGAARLLVRFANAWDDVPTVLLLVVLLFPATSVTFDEMLVPSQPRPHSTDTAPPLFAGLPASP